MSGFTFDANIVIDALRQIDLAARELRSAASLSMPLWMSRVAWIEVMSKGAPGELPRIEKFLSGFEIDELDQDIAGRAAALRRERPKLRSPDAIILATAQLRGRTLVTRNTKDFPADMPGIRVPYIL